MLDPDYNYKDRRIADAQEEAQVAALARVSCEEVYDDTYIDEPQYGMDPEYDSPPSHLSITMTSESGTCSQDFGDLSPEEVDMLNRALGLTSRLMAITLPEAVKVLDLAHRAVDEMALDDDLPF